MLMDFVLAAEQSMEMVKSWADISANTIKALKIMGMGLLAIFIVIGVIILAVTILNAIDKKVAAKKLASESAGNNTQTKANIVAPVAPKAITEVASNNEVPNDSENEALDRDELGDGHYRKGKDMTPKGRYRKRD